MIDHRDIDSLWESLQTEAERRRDSHFVLEELVRLHRDADDDTRQRLRKGLPNWLWSDNEAKRFDAIYLADYFQIVEMLPELRKLHSDALTRRDPGAPFLASKLERTISRLE